METILQSTLLATETETTGDQTGCATVDNGKHVRASAGV
jgi:hypothetical protein